MNKNWMPTGNLQGDTSDMPDRGTSTGVTDSYGANLSGTNRKGGLGNAAKSDSAFETDAEAPGTMDGDE